MEIYHGSYTIIEHPKLMDRRFTKDFGNGFYCTILRHQSERWAGRYDTPIIDIYEYKENLSLKIKKFENMTDEWLDFVVDCRLGKPHDYDIVMGAMATVLCIMRTPVINTHLIRQARCYDVIMLCLNVAPNTIRQQSLLRAKVDR